MSVIAKPQFSIVLLGLAAFTLSPAPVSTPIFAYIQKTWKQLMRSNQELASAAADPKFTPAANGRWPVYMAKT
ncbi:MAG TPA: hypothetical protein VLW25_10220, partial [Bryobacteraceae bacterium]|nr:hypothetical protein [Bryobacteraceae bacterium]